MLSTTAKDSLVCLHQIHNTHKRPHYFETTTTTSSPPRKRLCIRNHFDDTKGHSSLTPLEQLRLIVAAKQQRKQKKQASFNLDRNRTHHIDYYPSASCWLSPSEADAVKQANLDTITAVLKRANDPSNNSQQLHRHHHHDECIRGLEIHLDPELLQKKMENGRHFVSILLEQQAILRNLLGRAADVMVLARISILLSSEDRQLAAQVGKFDEADAYAVYHDNGSAL